MKRPDNDFSVATAWVMCGSCGARLPYMPLMHEPLLFNLGELPPWETNRRSNLQHLRGEVDPVRRNRQVWVLKLIPSRITRELTSTVAGTREYHLGGDPPVHPP